ncbi:histidine kinase, partial [Klebsiella pneumoniae]|nr:histidine kinase [Klebsiella pneumoniae]
MADPTSPETGDAGQLVQLRRANESLRAELEETNQGVLALYAELDTQAEQLRQASDLK